MKQYTDPEHNLDKGNAETVLKKPDIILVSTLKRTMQTASIVFEEFRNCPKTRWIASDVIREADIFVLKHESSIFRSFIQPCMWFLHDGTGYTLYCLASAELAWHFQNHTQGWMNDLNMLLSCFRTKMSVEGEEGRSNSLVRLS